MIAPTRWVAATVGGALILAAWLWSGIDDPDPSRAQALAPAAAQPQAPVHPALASLSAAAPSASAPRSPEDFEHWLEEKSSLRGVSLDGAWDIDSEGRLKPTMALRRRFDQLLTLVGEATLDEIAAYVDHDVTALAGPAAAQQVLDVWRRYVELQKHAFNLQVDMRDRNTWAPAQAERQDVRRRLLGEPVARAFYAEEDTMLQAVLAAPPAATVSFQSIDKSTLPPDAAERLRQEEVAWADWERRLADAKREQAALQSHEEMSQAQRDEALNRYVAQRFKADELVRVRALLQAAKTSSP
jgi:lipase chaperone LimK